MGLFGAWVTGATVWHVESGTIPRFEAMGAVAVLALLANAAVLGLLWAYRRDSNMRSVWLCSRNDVIGNVAVMLAALGVWLRHRLAGHDSRGRDGVSGASGRSGDYPPSYG